MVLYTILPSGIGASDAWTLGAGATKWQACQTSDGATSYITSGGGAAPVQYFTYGPMPALALLATVEVGGNGSLGVHYSPGLNEGIEARIYLGGNFVNTFGDYGTTTWAYRNFGPYSYARPGGGSWAPADLATVQGGVRGTMSSAASTYNLSYLYLRLDGTPPSGGYIALIAGLAGAAVGLSEMSRLAREVFKRTRARILPAEYETAWRELRYDPRRRIFA